VAGIDSTAGRGRRCLFGWAAEKVAGGVGVGHRVGVVDVEDQGKAERVAAGDQGFLQDAIAPDTFERNAAQLVLIEEVSGDRFTAQRADARDQDVPVGGVRPGDAPVSEPAQQSVAGELAEALPWPARVMRRLGRSMSSRVSSRMALGRAACTAASVMASRWAGVTAACSTARICSAVIGSMVRPAPRPPRRCRVGSANVKPCRLANWNSERSAMMAL
jgi:hypothetical protein